MYVGGPGEEVVGSTARSGMGYSNLTHKGYEIEPIYPHDEAAPGVGTIDVATGSCSAKGHVGDSA